MMERSTMFRRLGQPVGGLPASAFVPAAAILPTSSPSRFPIVTMPPSVVVDHYRPAIVEPVFVAEEASPVTSPTTRTLAIAAAVGVGVLGLVLLLR